MKKKKETEIIKVGDVEYKVLFPNLFAEKKKMNMKG